MRELGEVIIYVRGDCTRCCQCGARVCISACVCVCVCVCVWLSVCFSYFFLVLKQKCPYRIAWIPHACGSGVGWTLSGSRTSSPGEALSFHFVIAIFPPSVLFNFFFFSRYSIQSCVIMLLIIAVEYGEMETGIFGSLNLWTNWTQKRPSHFRWNGCLITIRIKNGLIWSQLILMSVWKEYHDGWWYVVDPTWVDRIGLINKENQTDPLVGTSKGTASTKFLFGICDLFLW